MTAKVRVNMFPCDNKTEIEASVTANGNYAVRATSTCPKAEKFINGLGELTIADLTDKKQSKAFREFIDTEISANCLVLSGVLTAAWVEAGMIARSMARKKIPLCIEFLE